MARWKLFSRSKHKEEKPEHEEVFQVESKETIQPESEKEQEESTLAEYHETLYAEDSTSKKKSIPQRKSEASHDQRIWRDVAAIEENIDNIHMAKAKKPHSGVEKTVDKLIEKRKIEEIEDETHRKPSNVIYVVSKPQPGQVRGDWAVRGHGKIYSHHRKKENAIKEARKIAGERNATVMVQNTDGTFSEGFKPRQKK